MTVVTPNAKMGRRLSAMEIDDSPLPTVETPEAKRRRIRSIQIVHFGMFIFGLGFSIVITGVYPYMIQVLVILPGLARKNLKTPVQLFPSSSPSTLLNRFGFVVSVNPLGQLLFSPLFGFLANKFKSIRAITMVTCLMYVGGNVVYSTLSLWPEDTRYPMLLLGRFMVGVSTGPLNCLKQLRHFNYIALKIF